MITGMFKRLHFSTRGFTLVEILVVIAILGVLAAVAIPNVGKFVGQGKNESYNSELRNLQTGIMAMLSDSNAGTLDGPHTDINNMGLVTADNSSLILSAYMAGLNSDSTVKTGCTYTISKDGGIIIQSTP